MKFNHKLKLLKQSVGSQKARFKCLNCGQLFAFYGSRSLKETEKYVNKYYPENSEYIYDIVSFKELNGNEYLPYLKIKKILSREDPSRYRLSRAYDDRYKHFIWVFIDKVNQTSEAFTYKIKPKYAR